MKEEFTQSPISGEADAVVPIEGTPVSRWRGRTLLAWLLACLVALAVVAPIEISGWRAGGDQHHWLVGINIDSAPYLVLLLLALVLGFWRSRGDVPPGRVRGRLTTWLVAPAGETPRGAWLAALLVGGLSIAASMFVAARPVDGPVSRAFGDLPPAYHDEYSYLFQARTFLAGRLAYPGHDQVPRLFDQMHVLNEGRFASRYFPGVGAWLAPFVAIGHPVWGHWLAGAITAMAVLGAGRELAGNGVGLLAGLLTAVAPGLALFSNLLLSHHPALAGLSMFLFMFLRMQRTGCPGCGLAAGAGLAVAMLCRPLTAAAIGLPFGCWLAWWWLRGDRETAVGRRSALVASVGVPVILGLGLMFGHNLALTGSGWTTSYQVFTDTYTPRHVYGFNNVVRGERRIEEMKPGSRERVLDHYDRWAENLDWDLAGRNTLSRLVESGKWTVGLVPLLMTSVVIVVGGLIGAVALHGRRWLLVVGSLLALYLAYTPYWYAGIMGWHYVFESAPLWCLLVAGVTGDVWQRSRHTTGSVLPLAWIGMLLICPLTGFAEFEPVWSPSRIDAAVSEVGFARRRHADFQEKVARRVGDRRALVLVQADPADRHIDHVVNSPSLDAHVLVGRYVPGLVPMSRVLALFPDRGIFVFDARSGRMREVRR